MTDWWSTVDSEPSQTELVQMDASHTACSGPEFALSLHSDHDAPYVTVCKGTGNA